MFTFIIEILCIKLNQKFIKILNILIFKLCIEIRKNNNFQSKLKFCRPYII